MKKILSLLLAMIMVFSLATVAFAAEGDDTTGDGGEDAITPAPTYTDMSTVTFVKWYKNPNAGVSPAETFTFSHEKVGVTEPGVLDTKTGAVVTKDTMPDLISVSDAVYNEGDAGKTEITNDGNGLQVNHLQKKEITVTLPEYTAVGIYEYKITENAGKTAGVTYHSSEIKLVVTVIEQDGKVRVAAVHAETQGDKDDQIVNIYESGSLAVTKIVTGNMGDKEKEFDVKVVFTCPKGEIVNSKITYTDNNNDGSTVNGVIEGGWKGNAVAYITLKHDETVTFNNIPEGVTYEVTEGDYTIDLGGEYDAPVYEFSDSKKLVDAVDGSNLDTVTITNNKDVEVDTGIALDSAPYFLMLAVALFGMVALVSKKRYEV